MFNEPSSCTRIIYKLGVLGALRVVPTTKRQQHLALASLQGSYLLIEFVVNIGPSDEERNCWVYTY